MDGASLQTRLGLSVPYEWWPASTVLKEIEAAGFGWVQIPSPPASVLINPRQGAEHAKGLAEALETATLRRVLHAPGDVQAGTARGDRALKGLLSYAAETGAGQIAYHAANFPDRPASEDSLLAETRSLARLAGRAERLGVTITLENLAPVFPGPDALCFSPSLLRTMAKRISSPAVGLCLDVGHANIVADRRHADILELIEPALDCTELFHLHDNLGSRRGPAVSPEIDPLRLDLHLPPGRGTVPWGRLAPLLSRNDAPLLLEVHPPRPAAAAMFAAATEALESQPPRVVA